MTAAPTAPVPPGLVVVDKPAGLTSHDVVARVRRLADTRKVGHAGTLDPMATGVLVLGIGRATRLLGHLMLTEKGYDATIRLGRTTTTDDADGEVLATSSTAGLDESSIRTALGALVGDIEQVPTSVSAIKVDGKRAYQRVRDGEDVVLRSRPVTIHELVVHDVLPVAEEVLRQPSRSALDHALDVRISVRCSSGTYIRAIARDLGAGLGVGGHLTVLQRTAVGTFDLAIARTLDQLGRQFDLVPLTHAARASFPGLDLDPGQASDVRFGRALHLDLRSPGPVALFDPDGEFLALYEQRAERAVATAVFV